MAQNRVLAKLSSWFFANGTEKSVRANYTRFLDGHDPSENTHRELLEHSVAMFAETESRAKKTTGGAINLEQGLVTMATDAQAKANTAQLTDRSLAVEPSQLPTVVATQTDVVDDFNDIALTIAADGTTTRNNYLVRLSTNFKTWLGTISTNLTTAETEITSLRTLTGTAGGVNDLGVFAGGITIPDGSTIKNALALLEAAVEAGGTGSISGGLSSKTYATLTTAGSDLVWNLDEAAFRVVVTNAYYLASVLSKGDGTIQIMDNTTPLTPKVKDLVNGTGIDWIPDGTRLRADINTSWLTSQVNALIAASGGGGSGLGPGEVAYLFKAQKTTAQNANAIFYEDTVNSFALESRLSGDYILFENDGVLPNFDNGGVWGINKFAHGEVSSKSLRFVKDSFVTTADYTNFVKISTTPSTIFQGEARFSFSTANLIGAVRVGNVTTVTHLGYNLVTGMIATIAGFTGASNFNGSFSITVLTSTTFTYSNAGVNETAGGAGTHKVTSLILPNVSVNGGIYKLAINDLVLPGVGSDLEVVFPNTNGGLSSVTVNNAYVKDGYAFVYDNGAPFSITNNLIGGTLELQFSVYYSGLISVDSIYNSIAPAEQVRLFAYSNTSTTATFTSGIIYNQD